jgi:hypothetical protein
MHHPRAYQRLHPPSGPAAMILPTLILGPLGLLLLAGGLESIKSSPLLGMLYCSGGALIFAFLCFCFALHVRAQQVWAWHLRTGRVPTFRTGGFWKGALLGGVVGLAVGVACTALGWRFAEHPVYGGLATAAFYLAFLWGGVIVVVLALITGWGRRAWDRTAIPSR